MVRDSGVAARGPHPGTLLDPVPRRDLVRAILDGLPEVIADLESDTRNVLPTLARMWLTVVTGRIESKDAAATWAIERLPLTSRAVLERARAGYLGSVEDRWDDMVAVRATADVVVDRIRSDGAP